MRVSQRTHLFASLVSLIFFLAACGKETQKQKQRQNPSGPQLPPAAPCGDAPGVDCYELSLPLEHADPASERIGVTFAVSPASSASPEVLLVLFGGPGDPGIFQFGKWLTRIDPRLKARYTLVTMDLRGVQSSGKMDCPDAAWNFSFVRPWTYSEEEKAALAAGAETAANDCVRELGKDPEVLQHFNSDEAAADLESFRQLWGVEAWSIYALSYGTQLAQTYVTRFPGHTQRLVLDGAVDLTADLLQYGEDLALAQNKIFADLDAFCAKDASCSAAFTSGGKLPTQRVPTETYDGLFSQLLEAEAPIRYKAADGTEVTSVMTAYDLEYALSSSVSSPERRARFLWALARTAATGDFAPLYRIADGSPEPAAPSPEPVPESSALQAPGMSQGVFWTFICNDYGSPAGENFAARFARFALNAAPHVAAGLRIHYPFFSESPCAAWPLATEKARPSPFNGTGVPTLLIGAEADANVPYKHSLGIAAHLEEGRLISVSGSQHISYSYHISCVNERVENFLLFSELPKEPVSHCEDRFVAPWPAD